MRARAVLVLVGTLVLAGCAAPPPPAGPTEAEIQDELARRSAQWWESFAPDEPMPVIEPVRVVEDYSEQWWEVRGCIADLELEGIESDPLRDYWVFTSDDPEVMRAFERAQWECAARFPVDPASPDHAFTLSDERARWLWDYYSSRLIPCIQAHGFPLTYVPSRDEFLAQRWWSPYFALSQTPVTAREIAMLDAACPPPPFPVDRPY